MVVHRRQKSSEAPFGGFTNIVAKNTTNWTTYKRGNPVPSVRRTSNIMSKHPRQRGYEPNDLL